MGGFISCEVVVAREGWGAEQDCSAPSRVLLEFRIFHHAVAQEGRVGVQSQTGRGVCLLVPSVQARVARGW